MESKAICTPEQAGKLQKWGAIFANIHGRKAIVDGRHAILISPDGQDYEVKARGKFHDYEAKGTPPATDEQERFVADLTWSPWSDVIIH